MRRLMLIFVHRIAAAGPLASSVAYAIASSISLSAGTQWLTRPMRSASGPGT